MASLPRISRLTLAADPVARPHLRRDRWYMWLVLGVAFLQGLLYLFLLPPWQHYDEQNHFEYAWLLANYGWNVPVDQIDSAFRREIAASLQEYRFHGSARGTWLNDGQNIEIGLSQRGHPRVYYALVSIPLRLVSHLDVVSQLYVARFVSFTLFLCTIAIAGAIMRDLTPPDHGLRWAVPLSLALLPPFVDVMTAVNNDVGAVAVFSLFLWGAVRTIRFGITWRRVVWVALTALLCLAVKNTVFVAVPLLPFVLIIAGCVRHPQAWRWAIGGAVAMIIVGSVTLFGWGDAAYWYRRASVVNARLPTSQAQTAAPFGTRAFTLVASPNDYPQQLIYPLSPSLTNQLAGQTVTVGGWLWADQPTRAATVGLSFNETNSEAIDLHAQPLALTTTPTFWSQTFTLPTGVRAIHYTLQAAPQVAQSTPVHLFLDGVLLTKGTFDPTAPPSFDNSQLTTGSWAGQRFTNLIRNASAEQTWPRSRPRVDQVLARYSRHSPAQFLLALLDVQRTGSTLMLWSLPTSTLR